MSNIIPFPHTMLCKLCGCRAKIIAWLPRNGMAYINSTDEQPRTDAHEWQIECIKCGIQFVRFENAEPLAERW